MVLAALLGFLWAARAQAQAQWVAPPTPQWGATLLAEPQALRVL
jgi:hypothetical protein